jgi:hypothetical protein
VIPRAFSEQAKKIHELTEEIVRSQGTASERFGLKFGLYPLWAVEEAKRRLKSAELGSSGSSANLKRR